MVSAPWDHIMIVHLYDIWFRPTECTMNLCFSTGCWSVILDKYLGSFNQQLPFLQVSSRGRSRDLLVLWWVWSPDLDLGKGVLFWKVLVQGSFLLCLSTGDGHFATSGALLEKSCACNCCHERWCRMMIALRYGVGMCKQYIPIHPYSTSDLFSFHSFPRMIGPPEMPKCEALRSFVVGFASRRLRGRKA